MSSRYCADPCCGKILAQRPDETNTQYKKRKYCNKRCASQHTADKRS